MTESPLSICCWNEGLKDQRVWPWLERVFDVTRVLVHVDGTLDSGAEFFITGNGGMTVRQQCEWAIALGHKLILCHDNFLGNGRDDPTDSPTGNGPYHYSFSPHGGMSESLDKILNWPRSILDQVIGYELLNEPYYQPNGGEEQVKRTMKWSKEFLTQHVDQLVKANLPVIVSPDQAAKCKGLFDIIDVHLVFVDPAEARSQVKQLTNEYPDNEVWTCELVATAPGDTRKMIKHVVSAGATGYSGWSGNRQDFPQDWYIWNGKQHEYITHWLNAGLTERGRKYAKARGVSWPSE